MHGGSNVGKGRKRLAPGMQEDQIVVVRSGECPLGANPEDASLDACEPSCGLRFGEVAITPFVILHARLGDEQLPVRQRPHDIGQILMGFALKRVANGEWRMFGDGQSVGRGKLRANVATRVADHLGMVFEPQQKSLFELATERLPDRGCRTRLEAGNPS